MMILLAALALTVADPADSDYAPPSLADLQQVYDQSCASREFGAYDDVCDQLRRQIRQAEAEEARAARRKPAKALTTGGSKGKETAAPKPATPPSA